MAASEKKDSAESKPRYVWDRQKLTWVEAGEEPAREELQPATSTEESREGTPEEVSEEGTAEQEEVPIEEIPAESLAGAEGLQYKGALVRLLGFIIDAVLIFVAYFILWRILGSETDGNGEGFTGNTLIAAITLGLMAVYFVGLWSWRGQTLGKMIIGAKVVKADGSPVGFIRSLIRFIIFALYFMGMAYSVDVPALDIVIGIFVFLTIALTRKKRGLHDWIAGTAVINSRPSVPIPIEAETPETSETAEYHETGETETEKQE